MPGLQQFGYRKAPPIKLADNFQASTLKKNIYGPSIFQRKAFPYHHCT